MRFLASDTGLPFWFGVIASMLPLTDSEGFNCLKLNILAAVALMEAGFGTTSSICSVFKLLRLFYLTWLA